MMQIKQRPIQIELSPNSKSKVVMSQKKKTFFHTSLKTMSINTWLVVLNYKKLTLTQWRMTIHSSGARGEDFFFVFFFNWNDLY